VTHLCSTWSVGLLLDLELEEDGRLAGGEGERLGGVGAGGEGAVGLGFQRGPVDEVFADEELGDAVEDAVELDLEAAVADGYEADYVIVSYYDDLRRELESSFETDYSGIDRNIKVFSIHRDEGSKYLIEYCMYFVDGRPQSLYQEHIIYRAR